jgi:prephenate dehydrogenase
LARIAILGLGLIGGSLGLALKQSRLRDVELVGYSRSKETRDKARRAGAIDTLAPDAAAAVRDASIVIIATPILTIRQMMEEIAPALPENCTVTDVGSTKADVLRWAGEILPDHVSFVGGHPMAGRSLTGIDAAEAGLFEGKTYCIVPSVTAKEAAVNSIVGLVELVKAVPVYMDAEEHDSYVAAVSHLPLVVSTALFSLAHDSVAWPELSLLASSGFRDVTRLASGSPDMSHDICRTNRENLVHWLNRMVQELLKYRELIQGDDDEELFKAFARAQLDRDVFITQGPQRREERGAAAEASIGITDLLVGSWASRRSKEIMKSIEQDSRDKDKQDGRHGRKR